MLIKHMALQSFTINDSQRFQSAPFRIKEVPLNSGCQSRLRLNMGYSIK